MGNLADTLIQAGLLNEVQLQVAMHDLIIHPDMRLSEVLALRGWIDEETVDFFELLWEMRLQQTDRNKIGQYFLEARLMTEAQLNDVLAEQKYNHLRFGEIATLKGYLKQETVRFFVKQLYPEQLNATKASPFARTKESSPNFRRTMSNDGTMQQTEENVVQENKSYQQQVASNQKLEQLQAAQQKKTNLFDRLKQQVIGKPVAMEEAKQKPVVQEQDAFSTCFDLSAADDLEMDDLL